MCFDQGINGDDVPCSEEDDGWISGENDLNDYCYMKMNQARSWQYANDHCRHHGGHLASVHSKAENDFIQGDYWIGLINLHQGSIKGIAGLLQHRY